jgi:acid phosphatase
MPSLSTVLALAPALALASVQPSSETYHFDPLQHLAGITPYFTPLDPPTDPAPPQGCNVTRAAYLVRHAAIYANDFDYESYVDPFVQKLSNTTQDWTTTQKLHFLSSWTSPIEDEDLEELTKVGQLEAMRLGIDLEQRYPTFSAPKKVWSSTADRTVKSAQSLIYGLSRYSNETQLVEVYEGEEDGANTLTPYDACPAYSSSRGSDQSSVSPQSSFWI